MPMEECCVDLDLGELPEEVAEYARVNLGETPETRLKCIQELRDMIYGKLYNILINEGGGVEALLS